MAQIKVNLNLSHTFLMLFRGYLIRFYLSTHSTSLRVEHTLAFFLKYWYNDTSSKAKRLTDYYCEVSTLTSRKILLVLIKVLLSVSALALTLLILSPIDVKGQTQSLDVIVGDKAIFLLPPEAITGGTVTQFKWSDDGQYLMIVIKHQALISQQAIQKTLLNQMEKLLYRNTEVVIWNAKTNKVTSYWKGDLQTESVKKIEWLSKTNIAMAHILSPQPANKPPLTASKVLRIEPRKGETVIFSTKSESPEVMTISPDRTVVLVKNRDSQGKIAFWYVNKDIKMGQLIPMPPDSPDYRVLWTYEQNEFQPVFQPRTDLRQPGIKYYLLLPNFELQGLTERPNLYESQPAIPVELPYKIIRQNNSLWLKVESAPPDKLILISADGEQGTVAPTLDKIAYISQGAIFIRQIAVIPKEILDKAISESQLTQLINSGKLP